MEQFITLKKAAERFHVDEVTLRRWEAKGALVPIRTPGLHRRYVLSDIENAIKAWSKDDTSAETILNMSLPPAERVRTFIETHCRQSKHPWAGEPVRLMDWQWNEIIRPLYGTWEGETRRYNQLFLFCPKCSGKSTLGSALCIYHLLEYPGANVATIACNIEQARIIFDESAAMCEQDDALSKRFKVRRNIRTIEDKLGYSTYKVLSGLPTGKAGFNFNFLVLDELLEWPKRQAREIWQQLANSTMKRQNSIKVVMSTAQFDFTEHIGHELYLRAKLIKENPLLEPKTLPVIYEASMDADWQSEEVWRQTIPCLNEKRPLVPIEFYRDEFAKCKDNPVHESIFKTHFLNMFTGSSTCWISPNVFQSCGLQFNEEDLHGLSAVAGIDYASRHDLCAYVVLVEKDGLYYLLPRFFIPKMGAEEKQKRDHVPYLQWSKNPANNLYLTDGDRVDPAFMRAKLMEDAVNFDIVEVRYDPWGLEESSQLLQQEGLNMVECNTKLVSQFSPCCGYFERSVQAKRIVHPLNPILTWNLSNCVVRPNTTDKAIMIDKSKSTNRIDGIVASCLACGAQLGRENEIRYSIEDLISIG